MNYSITPIIFRDKRYNSIKEAIEQTGLSRYNIKKESIYVNSTDAQKFQDFGRAPKTISVLPTKEQTIVTYKGSVRKAARQLGITEPIMNQLLTQYNIPKISLSEAIILKSDNRRPTKEHLLKNYNMCSVEQLCAYYHVGRSKLFRWFKQYDIAIRSLGETASIKTKLRHEMIRPTKEVLEAHYKKNNIYEIALEYGVDKHVVSGWLNEHGIEVNLMSSRAETELFEFCQSLDDSFIRNDRKIIGPFELDIVSTKHKLAIEYCGIYWHAEISGGKSRSYHRNKYIACKEKGYTLITVFETDDIHKVKDLIRTKVGSNKRIYARNTIIKEIDTKTARHFHESYHLSQFVGGEHIGLYYGNELVMAVAFSKSRYSKKYQYECGRMTSHGDYTIVGGASKLFKYFMISRNASSCVTYADLRFGEGKVYEYCGFVRLSDSGPNYYYINPLKTMAYSRVKYQKHKLNALLPIYDETLSESQNMFNNKYDRIFDCGNAVYAWYK